MSLLIKKEGILTTLQDLGRNGFRQFGINPNGAMDQTAARLINILLGNDETEAIIETHFPAPEILFEQDAIFALGGADFGATLNDEPIENWKINFAGNGSVLKFAKKKSGNRCCFSVKGGFKIEKWLGSASTNLTAKIGGFSGRKLEKGDRLLISKIQDSKFKIQNLKISSRLLPFYSVFPTVRIIKGAEFDNLTAISEQQFLSEIFTISNDSNRMGYRLEGKPLYLLNKTELVSSAVDFGTIQLLPDGQIIVLMADHQTTGGYPRLGNIISIDLPLVAQLGANDKIGFHLISINDAENLLLKFEKDLNFLKIGSKFAFKA
ncbi:MAG: biotin-dependent carboxyltransferase family protein [Pyrinomonadaceae bacterium]